MIYWIVLFTLVLLLLLLYQKAKTNRSKKWVLFVLIILLTYFSGFRDGIGMDYSANKGLCERSVLSSSPIFLIEPLFSVLTNICFETRLSAVFLFLTCAFITIGLSLYVYSKYENFAISAFFFVFYPGLYLQSMNIIRQFVATSIILYGTYMLLRDRSRRSIFIFYVLLLIAFLFHKTALIMCFIPFLTNSKDYNIYIIIIALIISLTPIGSVLGMRELSSILESLDYSIYIDAGISGSNAFSLSNLFMHSLLLPFLLYKQKVKKLPNYTNIVFFIKMFVCFLVFNNLTSSSFSYSYRLAIYYLVFVPILLAYLCKIISKDVALCWIVIPVLIIMSYRLYIGDRLTVPSQILPLNSIVDKNYHPYENPNYYFY